MVLFKESLAQWSPARKAKTEHSLSECITHPLLCSYTSPALSQDFVENAVTFLVTRFMPLNPKDLEGWMMNPEEWVNTEDKDDEQWQFEIRVSLKLPPIRISLSESIAMCGASSHDLCEPISRVCFPTTCEGIRQCQW